MVSAIQIKAIDPILIRASFDPYTDMKGRIWQSDTTVATRGTISRYPKVDITNTTEDDLFLSERYGDFSYEIPITQSGRYQIIFYFAELFFDVVGKRIFDIYVEYQIALPGIDLVALGNNRTKTAIALEYITDFILDGGITIDFNLIGKNFPKINAVEINLL
jgi:hypothetical protein